MSVTFPLMLTLLNVIYVRNCNGRFRLAFGMKFHAKNCTQNACISNFLHYRSWFSSPLQVTWGKSSYPWKWNEIQLLQNQDQWRYLRKLILTNCSGSQGMTHMWPWSLLTGKKPCFLTRSIWKLTFSIFFLSIGECLITRVLPLVSRAKVSPEL